MNAWICKEIRQSWKWTLLALVGMASAMAYSLYSRPWDSVSSYTFLTVTTFGSAVMGSGLCFLQLFPDLRRDEWAFMMHRPISPERILGAKLFAGGMLYLAATLLPFLAAAFWASRPGNVPGPFYWG